MARYRNPDSARWALIEAREAKGMTVYDVSRLTHYSPMTIMNAERGTSYNRPKLYRTGQIFFETMSELYGIDAETLKKRGRES